MISQRDVLEIHNCPDRFDSFASNDPDETRAFATSVYCPHEFRLAGREKTLSTKMASATLQSVGLSSVGFSANVTVDPDQLENFYLVQTVIAGSVDVTSGAQRSVSDANTATVISPNQSTRMIWDRAAHFLTVKIERDALENQLVEMLGESIDVPVVFNLDMDMTNDAVRPWRSVVEALYQNCRYADWNYADDTSCNLFERWLMSTLLHSQPHNYSAKLARHFTKNAPKCVRVAATILDKNRNTKISTKELAVKVGVSERKLRDLFRRCLGKTTRQYQVDNQLQLVRARLRNGNYETTVTRVLSECGVVHHGRFSALYKARYGELPSATLNDAAMPLAAVSSCQISN